MSVFNVYTRSNPNLCTEGDSFRVITIKRGFLNERGDKNCFEIIWKTIFL